MIVYNKRGYLFTRAEPHVGSGIEFTQLRREVLLVAVGDDERYVKPEQASPSRFTLYQKLSAHCTYEPLADSETEPSSAFFRTRSRLAERVEDHSNILGFDSYPGIGHVKAKSVVFSRNRESDTAAVCELHSVP